MTTGPGPARLSLFSLNLANSAFVALLLVMGLLMTPVSCTCGASVPHGHSLFQLPHHHHGSVENVSDHDLHTAHQGASLALLSEHQETGPLHNKADCDGNGHYEFSPGAYVALSNIAEKQDGAALKAPPTSSIGQPMSMTQPSMVTLTPEKCESITLPPVRILEGTDTSPETPPPRVLTLV